MPVRKIFKRIVVAVEEIVVESHREILVEILVENLVENPVESRTVNLPIDVYEYWIQWNVE